MLFGEDADESSDAPLALSQNWGNQNRTYVSTWISNNKLTHQVRVELEMHQQMNPVEIPNGEAQQHEGQQQNEEQESEEPQERRSGRRRS